MKAVKKKGARRRNFYPSHGDAAAVRKFEQNCAAVREIAAAQ
jgi:hypothetical protein